MNTASKLKIKGAWVPSIFIWMLSLIHGKLLKTAALGPDGRITSSYVTGKLKLFRELAAQRLKDIEQELKAVRVEASSLMAEESDLHHHYQLTEAAEGRSIQARRSNRRRDRQNASLLARRKEILARLTEIDSKINDCELLPGRTWIRQLPCSSGAFRPMPTAYCSGPSIWI